MSKEVDLFNTVCAYDINGCATGVSGDRSYYVSENGSTLTEMYLVVLNTNADKSKYDITTDFSVNFSRIENETGSKMYMFFCILWVVFTLVILGVVTEVASQHAN